MSFAYIYNIYTKKKKKKKLSLKHTHTLTLTGLELAIFNNTNFFGFMHVLLGLALEIW